MKTKRIWGVGSIPTESRQAETCGQTLAHGQLRGLQKLKRWWLLIVAQDSERLLKYDAFFGSLDNGKTCEVDFRLGFLPPFPSLDRTAQRPGVFVYAINQRGMFGADCFIHPAT